MRLTIFALAALAATPLAGCVGGEHAETEATKAIDRSADEAVKVFESACLDNRRDPARSVARLKELGFEPPEGARDGRLARGPVLASAKRDGKGVSRCFTSTPVADLAAIATDVHTLMNERFPGAVERGSAANSPAWKATPTGEPGFVVGVKAVSQGPDKPVLALITLAAPRK